MQPPTTSAGASGRGRTGFTLVELLVVVSIIALLVSILMPSLGKAKELTRRVVCKSKLHLIGRGWHMYWNANDNRQPGMVKNIVHGRVYYDSLSQYNDQLWGCWKNWTGAGLLWRDKYVQTGDAFYCPTVEVSIGSEWFCGGWRYGGNWPPHPEPGRNGYSWTSFGIRRMGNYDDPRLADCDSSTLPSDRTKDIMLMKTGVGNIRNPADFSLMADCFRAPWVAIRAHVPGINVLYVDGHVGWFEDTTEDGEILYYGNGITDSYTFAYNWRHDYIWMIIDGYKQIPVGGRVR